MTPKTYVAPFLQRFFTTRLIQQKQVSHHTISSYRDTFRLLFDFVAKTRRRTPSYLSVSDLDASLISKFLNELEKKRGSSPRSRNLRLSAIRSFFGFLSFELPSHVAQIQQVLAIPGKRYTKRLVNFLTRAETEALLASPDLTSWSGRRDHALLLLAAQTGLRLSELTALVKEDVIVHGGAHVRVVGKGRKERCTPLTKQTAVVMRAWLKEPVRGQNGLVFTNAHGGKLSADGVQYIVTKHTHAANLSCSSLSKKRVTPHVLRHTAAMELLQAGVDRTVIALWLGHESIQTTQMYLDADLAIKEKALAKVQPLGKRPPRYRPDDSLLAFLKAL